MRTLADPYATCLRRRIAVFLLLPLFFVIVPMAGTVVSQVLMLLHGLALAKAIVPAGLILAVVQVAWYIFAKVASY